MDFETKYLSLAPQPREGQIDGYAAIFDEPDRGGDVIAPGAFLKSLAERSAPVRLLWQHDPAQPIGVWDAITEDPRGLRVTGRLIERTRQGSEAAALLTEGAIDGLSIGYRTVKAEKQGSLRRLTEIELWEISLVTFPMANAARLSQPQEADIARAIAEAASAFRA